MLFRCAIDVDGKDIGSLVATELPAEILEDLHVLLEPLLGLLGALLVLAVGGELSEQSRLGDIHL